PGSYFPWMSYVLFVFGAKVLPNVGIWQETLGDLNRERLGNEYQRSPQRSAASLAIGFRSGIKVSTWSRGQPEDWPTHRCFVRTARDNVFHFWHRLSSIGILSAIFYFK